MKKLFGSFRREPFCAVRQTELFRPQDVLPRAYRFCPRWVSRWILDRKLMISWNCVTPDSWSWWADNLAGAVDPYLKWKARSKNAPIQLITDATRYLAIYLQDMPGLSLMLLDAGNRCNASHRIVYVFSCVISTAYRVVIICTQYTRRCTICRRPRFSYNARNKKQMSNYLRIKYASHRTI